MRSQVPSVFLLILGLANLVGNTMAVIWRCRKNMDLNENKTHTFLVVNLAISDLMMGFYMLIVSIAALRFGESYDDQALRWRESPLCKIAWVFAFFSSETSVFFITIISIECFLGIVFPFSTVRIRGKSSKIIACVAWLSSLTLTVIPTIVGGSMYGLSDLCIGLPLVTKPAVVSSRERFMYWKPETVNWRLEKPVSDDPPWINSIVPFICVNLLCFIIVLICYLSMFVSVKKSSKKVKVPTHQEKNVKLAIKMALIVGTDLACWLPIIIMGILSQSGAVVISHELLVWVVVLISPINSALNPYLYTFYNQITSRMCC